MFNSELFQNPGSSGVPSFYDYQISQSLRIGNESDYLSLASGSTSGNRNYWTFSCWVQRTRPNREEAEDGRNMIIAAGSGSGNTDSTMRFQIDDKDYPGTDNGDRIRLNSAQTNMGSTNDNNYRFIDNTGWFNIVMSNNNGSIIVYRNGHTHTTFSLDGGADSAMNSGDMYIGRSISNDSTLSGYIAEVIMISHSSSAAVLTATSFGEFKKNIWVPKDLSSLSYKDFYLKFDNASSLGTDSSGNSRTWTVNGCGVDHKSLNTPTSDG
jgi:hypothetical protein